MGARLVAATHTVLAGLLISAVAYLALGGMESYCVIWPSIDTRYAPDFSERRFARVEVGMTREQVVGLIGQPLGTGRYYSGHPAYKTAGDEVWTYTGDGAAWWGDWAWLSRQVIFRDGRVAQTVYWTYYD